MQVSTDGRIARAHEMRRVSHETETHRLIKLCCAYLPIDRLEAIAKSLEVVEAA